MSLPEILKTALDQVKSIANSRTVFGDPIIAGAVTIIPVSKVSVGFAAAGGGSGKDNAGTGGGIQVVPVALIVVRDGRVSVQTIDKNDFGLDIGRIAAAAPDLVKRLNEFFGKSKKKTETQENEDI